MSPPNFFTGSALPHGPAARAPRSRGYGVIAGLLLVLAAGCAQPSQFADAPLPTYYLPKSYQAAAEGRKLVLTVVQQPSNPISGFKKWVVEGNLYLEPQHQTTSSAPPTRFELDLAGEKLGPDWPARVFWAYNPSTYDPNDSGYWIAERRTPWVRQAVTVTAAPAAATPTAPPAGAQ